jgi:hypothetical protein
MGMIRGDLCICVDVKLKKSGSCKMKYTNDGYAKMVEFTDAEWLRVSPPSRTAGSLR